MQLPLATKPTRPIHPVGLNMAGLEVSDIEEPLFRPTKRRKYYRKYNGDDDGDSVANSTSLTAQTKSTELPLLNGDDGNQVTETAADDEDATCITIAEVLRRRQAARSRKGGIEFTNSANASKSESASPLPSRVLVERCDAAKELSTVVNRFAPQTGQVADVDKHM